MGAIDSARWTCTLSDYACRTPELPRPGEVRRGITGPVRGDVATMTPRPHVSPDGKWTVFAEFDGEPNGLRVHKDGKRLFVADHKLGLLSFDIATGKMSVVLNRPHHEGFKGLNDLHFAANGGTAHAKPNIDAYKTALAARGGPAQPKAEFKGGAAIGILRHIFVADTDEEAWEHSVNGNMGRMMTEYFLPLLSSFGFLDFYKEDPSTPDADVTVPPAIAAVLD